MKKYMCMISILVVAVFVCLGTAEANVTLNVNAQSNTSANKLTYTQGTSIKTYALPWKEKVVYNGGTVSATVKNTLAGDLIVKMELLSYIGGEAVVSTYWLKQTTINSEIGPQKIVGFFKDGDVVGGTTIDKENLTTLCLVKGAAANTTTTLLYFVTDWNWPGQAIFTAMLIDDVTASTPQVIGVDIQTILFNGSTDSDGNPAAPIWLNMIQSGN